MGPSGDSTPRLLLVDDDTAFAALVCAVLPEQLGEVELIHAQTLTDARTALDAAEVDVVLLDLGLPDSAGLEGVRALRAIAPTVSIVVLTGHDDAELAVRALRSGAQDYLPKGGEIDGQLARAVRYAIERARTQAALAHAHEQLDALVGHAPAVIYAKDLDGRYTLANPGCGALAGREPHELLGLSDAEIFPAPVADALRAQDAQTIAHGGPTTRQHRVVLRDRREHVFDAIQYPLRDGRGEVVGVAGIATEVTERLAVEAARHAAEERFRMTFDHAPIGMAITTLDGRLSEVNASFAELAGYSADELAGRSFLDLTHPEDRTDSRENIRALVAGKVDVLTVEKRYLHGDGHAMWLSLLATVLRDGDGRPTGLLAQVQDVTERRRAERELRHLADHDGLTGLVNRRRFEEELHRHAAEVGRYGATGALLLIDLDGFKQVNDTHGHGAGDELVVAIAGLLRSRLRDSDIVGRIGGDEFAVLLPRADRDAADAVAGALVDAVRRHAETPDGHGVTASVGVAMFEGDEHTVAEVLRAADVAMYEAKARGGSAFCRSTFTTA